MERFQRHKVQSKVNQRKGGQHNSDEESDAGHRGGVGVGLHFHAVDRIPSQAAEGQTGYLLSLVWLQFL